MTDDDVAVQDSLYTVGRRGVGVTVLVEKIAGAAAEQGRSLAEVADIARKVNAGGRSMGMALTSCTVPTAGKPTFDLPEDEMEVGIGIHGEPGRVRVPLAPAAEIAQMLVEPILDDLEFGGDGGVLAFVNGMGGTPLIELYLMYHEVDRLLAKAGITVARSLVGNYITSLDMAGCSVTLLKPRRRAAPAVGRSGQDAGAAVGRVSRRRARRGDDDGRRRQRCGPGWRPFAEEVADNRDLLTQLDSAIGDADHGANLDRGIDRRRRRSRRRRRIDTRRRCSRPTGMTLVSTVGGASGPLYGTLFLRMSGSAGDAESLDARGFAAALRAGLEGVVARGKAQAEDKTMYDALAPACDALDAALDDGRRPRRRAGRGQRRGRRRPGRHDADARPQGPRVVPRRAQRRPPGPGRDVDRAAGRHRRPDARAGGTAVTGLVVVSHSRALADAAVALAAEMLHGSKVRIAVAAGPRRDHVRHRRDGDRRRDQRGRRRRRASWS